MRVVILGTSPPQSAINPGRAGTGILVSLGDAHVLLDCGPRVTQRLAEAGVDVRKVDHVFLTHHHWDHIADLPVLVLGRWERSVLESANGDPLAAPLTIHGPPPTERIVSQLFGDGGIYEGDIKTRISVDMGQPIYSGVGATTPYGTPIPKARDLEPGVVLENPMLTVTAAEAQHTQPYLRSFAYRVDCSAGSVVFSGDTAPCEEVVELSRGADLLLHEGAMSEETRQRGAMQTVHSSPATVGQVASEARVKKLVIVHHHLEPSDEEARMRIAGEVRQHFRGEVQVAHELDEFRIDPMGQPNQAR
jgi:ribonuclease Z